MGRTEQIHMLPLIQEGNYLFRLKTDSFLLTYRMHISTYLSTRERYTRKYLVFTVGPEEVPHIYSVAKSYLYKVLQCRFSMALSLHRILSNSGGPHEQ